MTMRILVSSLGLVGNAQSATYYLQDDNQRRTHGPVRMSTIALINLLKETRGIPYPDRVLALTTQQSSDRYLKEELEPLGIRSESILCTDELSTEELRLTMVNLLDNVPPRCRLTIDLTHGLRHVPFLFFAATQYLSALRPGTEIEGVYYGMLKPGEKSHPIINLKILLQFMEWIYAVRVFRDTRAAANLSQCLADVAEDGSIASLRERLARFSTDYSLAFPLELGESARELRSCLTNRPDLLSNEVLLAEELFGEIASLASEFAFEGSGAACRALEPAELRRQAKVVDSYLDTGQLPQALGIIREWMISAYIYHNGNPEYWRREGPRRQLGGLKDSANPYVADIWERIRKWRNDFAHHGMVLLDEGNRPVDLPTVRMHWRRLQDNLENPEFWAPPPDDRAANGNKKSRR